MPDSAQQIFDSLIQRFAAAGISSPRLETRLLLAYILQCSANEVNPYSFKLDSQQQQLLHKLADERIAHKPLCKILGHKAFYKNEFAVSCDVLSPRPDTEILVEAAISLGQENSLHNILDFGTGSGCILLSVLADLPDATGVGVDISVQALKVAKTNAGLAEVGARASFVQGSWFDQAFVQSLGNFDLIVSNPPYIPTQDISSLEPEVKNYDPMLALDGGSDGFRDYRQLAKVIPGLLNPGGYVLLEAGIGQAHEISKIFAAGGLQPDKILSDLSGIERCVILKK